MRLDCARCEGWRVFSRSCGRPQGQRGPLQYALAVGWELRASLDDGTEVWLCPACVKETHPDFDEAYERAAANYDPDRDGRDWR